MRKIRTQLNTFKWTSIVNTDKIKSRRSTLTTTATTTTALTTTTTNIEMADVSVSASKHAVKSRQNEQSATKKYVKNKKSSSTFVDSNQDIKIIATSNQVVAELNQKFEKTDKKNDRSTSADDSSRTDDSITTPKKIFRNEAAAEKNANRKKSNLLSLPSQLLFGRRQRSYTLND